MLFDMPYNEIVKMLEHNVKPEMETFGDGNWHLINNLIEKKLLKPPYFVQLVLGPGSITPPTQWHIMTQTAFAPPNTIFNILGIGVHQIPMTTFALLMGMHVRIGMEDNIYYSRGVKAKNNGELVERVVRIAKECNRPIATPQEAREILEMSKNPTKYH